jgi:hypothetical protein
MLLAVANISETSRKLKGKKCNESLDSFFSSEMMIFETSISVK